ncbi:TPA: hypothetical protein N0F65_009184, partial [Lagenidium giganteum]
MYALLTPTFQTMMRHEMAANVAWGILQRYIVKRNMHNRIHLRKRLQDVCMAPGDDISEHMLKFDSLLMEMEAIGDMMGEDEKLIVLLGSVTSDYDAIVKIIENKDATDLLEGKDMLRREYERMKDRKVTESARRVGRRPRNTSGTKIAAKEEKCKCFRCNQYGQKQADCRVNDDGEHVFAATSAPIMGCATSHMTFDGKDFGNYKRSSHGTPIEIADGNQLTAIGSGDVQFKTQNGNRVTLTQVLHVPGLDKRLISVPALTEKLAEVHFKRDLCVISHNGKQLIEVPRLSKTYTVNVEAANRALDKRHDGGVDLFGDVRAEPSHDSKSHVDEELITRWHARLCHVGARLNHIAHACDDVPAQLAGHTMETPCEACLQGQTHVVPGHQTVVFQCDDDDDTMVATPPRADGAQPMEVDEEGPQFAPQQHVPAVQERPAADTPDHNMAAYNDNHHLSSSPLQSQQPQLALVEANVPSAYEVIAMGSTRKDSEDDEVGSID